MTGKVAIVTGGGSGIGRATVLRLAQDGFNIVVADANVEAAHAVSREAGALAGPQQALAIRADVAIESDVAATVASAVDRFGRLDCMINNAGVGGAFGPISSVSVEDWDYTFHVLVRGVFLGTKHASPALQASPAGTAAIVNIGSIAGLSGGSGPHAYSAAKAAVINLTQSTAVELADKNIRVNAVCPGYIATPLVRGRRGMESSERLMEAQPLQHIGQPEDVAAAVRFLVNDEARFVTGESLVVDGGLSAAGPRLSWVLGNDPASRGLTGVNRGTTGRPSVVRRHLDA